MEDPVGTDSAVKVKTGISGPVIETKEYYLGGKEQLWSRSPIDEKRWSLGMFVSVGRPFSQAYRRRRYDKFQTPNVLRWGGVSLESDSFISHRGETFLRPRVVSSSYVRVKEETDELRHWVPFRENPETPVTSLFKYT